MTGPGASVMDETQIAQAIRDGKLPSPQRIGNMTLMAMRVTGTGMAYRKARNEYAWRNPQHYLNDHFLTRCNGLPLIWGHPIVGLTQLPAAEAGAEYRRRTIGALCLPYIKGDEVWAVAKIMDPEAAELLAANRLSTSPGVVFTEAAGNESYSLPSGPFLVEGKPCVLDHLAICATGVWDKGGAPVGISNSLNGASSTMSNNDQITALQLQQKELTQRLDALTAEPTDADRAGFISVWEKGEQMAQFFGDSAGAPRWAPGETLADYSCRVFNRYKVHSKNWRDVDLSTIARSAALKVAMTDIYMDAQTAASRGVGIQPGQLRQLTKVDAYSGRRRIEFVGDDNGAWMAPFINPLKIGRFADATK